MSDGHTARLESALAGRYKIQRKLGEGGMASVYLAEDLKHERNVALKILKPELAAVIGAERFLAEIKTTANLQHPHILPLFDSGEADGFLYYVMPYIEGETLRDRIDREGQLGVDDAARIARDVADALDYAHRNDIIHRDIKPANVLLHDGRPVVADFGIALAISAAGGGRMTETGLSLGTPHYMSPEQASADRDLSARSDVYSLGCVLYEMLAGQPPHTGPSAQNILVRILTEDPRDVAELRRTVPPHVAATVMKSIEKLPADRFDTARQFMDALEDPNFTHTHVPRATAAKPMPAAAPAEAAPSRLVRGMAAAMVVLAGLAAWGWLQPAPKPPRPMATRAIVGMEEELQQRNRVIISPDGSHLAYVSGTVPSSRKVWVRRVDEERFRVLHPGDAFWPAFSPNGEWIVFEAGNALMKVALSGGAPRVVTTERETAPMQPHWGDDGTIVFSQGGSIYRVSENGGEPALIVDRSNEEGLGSPHLLPGGRGLLASAGGSFTTYYADLDQGTVVPLIPGGVAPRYIDTGHVLYLDQEGGLWARPFDPRTGQVSGEATPVLQGVGYRSGLARYDVSRSGTLVYGVGGASSGADPPGELVVVGLDGSEEVAPLPPRVIRHVRWAPDGERVAYSGTEPGDVSAPPMIYEYNVELQTTPTRLTAEGEINEYPAWSPDGTRIVFGSAREGSSGRDMYVKNVFDDSAPVKILSAPGGRARPDQWLEGDVLVFTIGNSPSRNNSWTMQIPDSATAQPYVAAEGNRWWARVAPQGDLAAYESDETGRYEIFVRAFPEPRQPLPVSSGGGAEPRWSPDGNTIYYWRESPGADSLFAARIQREPAFRVLSTDFVLAGDYREASDWDLHPDGDRFVTTRLAGSASSARDGASIEPERHLIVTNWFTELLAAVGEGGR